MTEGRDRYYIPDGNWQELNFALQLIADRLDRFEGLRDYPTFYQDMFKFPAGVDTGKVLFSSDTDQAEFVTPEEVGLVTTGGSTTITGSHVFNNGVLFSVQDVNGTIIHQFNIDEVPYFNDFNGYLWGDDAELITDIDQNLHPEDSPYFDEININQANFALANGTTPGPGQLTWNPDDGTLNVGLLNDVVLQVGQEQHYYPKNVSGSQIDNGEAVMFAGTIGASGKLQIDLAQSDVSIPAEYFMGLATQDIANNDFGYVTAFGLVRGIDTTGTPVGEVWSDGDLLYLSTTPGQLTLTPPTSPNPKILVAAVVYADANIGSLFVRPTWGDYLSSLHDVYISGIADNDILIWDDTNQRWANSADIIVDTVTVNESMLIAIVDVNGTIIHQYNSDEIPYFNDFNGYLWGDDTELISDIDQNLKPGDSPWFEAVTLGKNMSLTHDGTDGGIDTSTVTPSDLNITCGANKTIELQNVVYDDNQVSISNIRVPAANAPTERLYNHGIGGGVTFPVLGFAVNDYIYFDVQTYHAMKLNTILDNHLHFMTPTDGSGTPDRFRFQLDVIVAPIGGNWAVPTGSPFTKEHIIAADYTNLHVYDDIADIPASNSTVSTIYKCKFTRIAATTDEYAGEVYVQFTDCHYQKNTMGSRQEGVK